MHHCYASWQIFHQQSDKELCVDNRTGALIALTIHCLMGMQSFEVNSGGQDANETVKTGKRRRVSRQVFVFFPLYLHLYDPTSHISAGIICYMT